MWLFLEQSISRIPRLGLQIWNMTLLRLLKSVVVTLALTTLQARAPYDDDFATVYHNQLHWRFAAA